MLEARHDTKKPKNISPRTRVYGIADVVNALEQ